MQEMTIDNEESQPIHYTKHASKPDQKHKKQQFSHCDKDCIYAANHTSPAKPPALLMDRPVTNVASPIISAKFVTETNRLSSQPEDDDTIAVASMRILHKQNKITDLLPSKKIYIHILHNFKKK